MFVCYVNVDLLRRVMHGKSDTFVDKMGFKCEMGERKKTVVQLGSLQV